MKKKKKQFQREQAQKSIQIYLKLIQDNTYPNYSSKYIKEIKKLSQGFRIRLNREQKLQFCKKCNTPWNSSTRNIRFNTENKTKEYICKKCGHIKKLRYKQ